MEEQIVLRGGAWGFHANDLVPCNALRTNCTFMEPLEEGIQAQLTVNRGTVDHMGMLEVTFQVSKPNKKAWIGVFCADDEAKGVPDDEYIDWKWTDYRTQGALTFGPMVNMRCSWQFRFFIPAGQNKYKKLGESKYVRMSKGHEEPTQVHLASTNHPTEMRVKWTSGSVPDPKVWYGTSAEKLTEIAQATSDSYAANDMCHDPATEEKANMYRSPGQIYDALMEDLIPGRTYYYQVGSDSFYRSKMFQFTVPPAPGTKEPLSFFVYGDLGDWGIQGASQGPVSRTVTTLELMRQDINRKDRHYVAAMHDGDLSYAMGRTFLWDQFGTMIESVAAELPYMVSVGNHEYCHTSGGQGKDPSGAGATNGFHPPEGNYNGDSLGECGVPTDKRFHMPENGNKVFWYSFEMGLVHHTVISSEHDYTVGSKMYQWLQKDLAKVDRSITPWLILHLHRPLYCSEDFDADYRVSLFLRKHLEPLLGKYKVDIVFSGHYHAYERTCPVYKETCREDKASKKALAPVHIMVGSAGAELDDTGYLNVPWREVAQLEYGYGRMHIYNETHGKFEFVRNKDRIVADSKWIITNHNWQA
jgi:hypothetical protein